MCGGCWFRSFRAVADCKGLLLAANKTRQIDAHTTLLFASCTLVCSLALCVLYLAKTVDAASTRSSPAAPCWRCTPFS